MSEIRPWPFVALVLIATACGPGPELEPAPALAQSPQASVAYNGSNLNGSNLNGSNLNGPTLASTLAAVRFAGATLPSGELDSVWLDGSMLRGARGGQSFSGTSFVDAEFDGVRGDDTVAKVKIRSISAPPAGSDVWRYDVVFRQDDGSWAPICAGTGVPLAVAVNGRWVYRTGAPGAGGKVADPTAFTFGCPNAAIQKCVNMGYRPWANRLGVGLDVHHQACVRMVRADYCGDGVSHTTDGRTINVYDALGIQVDDRSWLMEAEWDPTGARCVSAINRSLLGVLCSDSLVDLGCGASYRFATGTLLMTETPAGPLDGLL